MGKKKVVLDTNVLISAFGWEGNPKNIFRRVVSGGLDLFSSYDQLAELKQAIEYPRLRFTNEQKQRFFRLILEVANIIKPTKKLNVIRDDPDDNIILECAVAGKVDFIITGDKHLLNLHEFAGIRIVTPREFVEML